MSAKIWLTILILSIACYLLFYIYIPVNVGFSLKISPKPQFRLSFEKDISNKGDLDRPEQSLKDIHSLTGSDSSSLSNVQRQAISNENNSFVASSGILTGSFNGTNSRLVLIYTTFFGGSGWAGQEGTGPFSQFRGKPCLYQNCHLTYQKNDFFSSDVVIFHGRDLPTVSSLRELNAKRPPNQAWVYFVLESPLHGPDTRPLGSLFNWLMTYHTDSDIYRPYGFYSPVPPGDGIPQTKRDYSHGKDKLVVWTVSNCNGKRFSYVKKLKKYIKVDIFGGCGGRACAKRGPQAEACTQILRSYKFQLAFENSDCEDYVTEKYWLSPMVNEIVPVVMGGGDYKKVAIPGSYINVLDFPSVKALADYLLFLSSNNTAYNEYFHWKTKYKADSLSSPWAPWTCNLCELANNATAKSKVYENLEEFWSRKQCNKFSGQFNKIIHQT